MMTRTSSSRRATLSDRSSSDEADISPAFHGSGSRRATRATRAMKQNRASNTVTEVVTGSSSASSPMTLSEQRPKRAVVEKGALRTRMSLLDSDEGEIDNFPEAPFDDLPAPATSIGFANSAATPTVANNQLLPLVTSPAASLHSPDTGAHSSLLAAHSQFLQSAASNNPSTSIAQSTIQSISNSNHASSSSLASSNAMKNIPAFLNKLYSMINDERSMGLIRWTPSGKSFVVKMPEDFSRDVLPRFFKHNNFSSFVRQLNMYGFHKVQHLQQGVLVPDDPDGDVWEFAHEQFLKDRPDLLVNVKRKVTRELVHVPSQVHDSSTLASPSAPQVKSTPAQIRTILQELASIKHHQQAISSDLHLLQRDNQVLWAESQVARERYARQQETVDKILRFLASVFTQNNKSRINLQQGKKRRLMIQEAVTSPAGEALGDLFNVSAPATETSPLLGNSDFTTFPPILSSNNIALNNSRHQEQATHLHDASQSVQAINDDIDMLQYSIENLTESLGIDAHDLNEPSGPPAVTSDEPLSGDFDQLLKQYLQQSSPRAGGIGASGVTASAQASSSAPVSRAASPVPPPVLDSFLDDDNDEGFMRQASHEDLTQFLDDL